MKRNIYIVNDVTYKYAIFYYTILYIVGYIKNKKSDKYVDLKVYILRSRKTLWSLRRIARFLSSECVAVGSSLIRSLSFGPPTHRPRKKISTSYHVWLSPSRLHHRTSLRWAPTLVPGATPPPHATRTPARSQPLPHATGTPARTKPPPRTLVGCRHRRPGCWFPASPPLLRPDAASKRWPWLQRGSYGRARSRRSRYWPIVASLAPHLL
jgi:hypothetical protein